MSLESCTQSIKKRVGDDSGLNASLMLDFGEDGVIHIDGVSNPNCVSNDRKEANCTIKCTLADFESMVGGDLDPTSAFMGGKLAVDGDMGVAMKLQGLM